MIHHCSTFKVFGNGEDKMILVADGQGYIVNNPFLTEMCVSVENIGAITTDLHFKCGQVDVISGHDLDKYINPYLDKSVLELMQIVNQKLRERD